MQEERWLRVKAKAIASVKCNPSNGGTIRDTEISSGSLPDG